MNILTTTEIILIAITIIAISLQLSKDLKEK
jgi:hypothetical protein